MPLIHQKISGENLKDYVRRFNQAILEVEDPSDKVIIMAMMKGLQPCGLFDSLSKNVPKTVSALQAKADKYIATKELAEVKRNRQGKGEGQDITEEKSPTPRESTTWLLIMFNRLENFLNRLGKAEKYST